MQTPEPPNSLGTEPLWSSGDTYWQYCWLLGEYHKKWSEAGHRNKSHHTQKKSYNCCILLGVRRQITHFRQKYIISFTIQCLGVFRKSVELQNPRCVRSFHSLGCSVISTTKGFADHDINVLGWFYCLDKKFIENLLSIVRSKSRKTIKP